MPYPILLLLALSLSGCAWETYQNAEGKTSLRQKYETGSSIYYQDGRYSSNMNYNQYRPERRVIRPAQTESDNENVRGTTWQKPKTADQL